MLKPIEGRIAALQIRAQEATRPRVLKQIATQAGKLIVEVRDELKRDERALAREQAETPQRVEEAHRALAAAYRERHPMLGRVLQPGREAAAQGARAQLEPFAIEVATDRRNLAALKELEVSAAEKAQVVATHAKEKPIVTDVEIPNGWGQATVAFRELSSRYQLDVTNCEEQAAGGKLRARLSGPPSLIREMLTGFPGSRSLIA